MEKGKLLMEGDLKIGEIVKGYIRFERVNEKGETINPGGFVADAEKGLLYGVWNGKEIAPFFGLPKAEKYARKLKATEASTGA